VGPGEPDRGAGFQLLDPGDRETPPVQCHLVGERKGCRGRESGHGEAVAGHTLCGGDRRPFKRYFFDVGAGCEGAVGAGDEDGADVAVGVEFFDGGDDFA